jgi:heptosyltransferase I
LHTQTKFRLLVVRLGAMGDILHALPAVTALRQMHPGWVIDWVVEPRWRALLAASEGGGHEASSGGSKGDLTEPLRNRAQPIVDRLYPAPTKDWRRAPLSVRTIHEINELRRSLKAGDYDTVIDLQGAVRSAVVGKMAGCQRLIGEAKPRERAARWLYTEQVETRGAHVIEQDVELAAAVAGDDLEPVTPWLPVDTAAEAWVDGILGSSAGRSTAQSTEQVSAQDGMSTRPAVLINPGAGWGAKRWPVERYAAVAQGLLEQGMRVLVNVGPGEEALAEGIVRSAGGAVALSCGLEQLIALTRRMALAIAGDTGPLHLACALGRPVVGIYGPTDPSRNGPFGTRFRVLRSPESRRDHTRHQAPEAGLLTIQPEDVLRAAGELLAEGSAE